MAPLPPGGPAEPEPPVERATLIAPVVTDTAPAAAARAPPPTPMASAAGVIRRISAGSATAASTIMIRPRINIPMSSPTEAPPGTILVTVPIT